MPKKNVSVEQRQVVATMTANHQSIHAIRKHTGLHDGTIKKMLAEPSTQALVEEACKHLAGKMLSRADEIVDAISPEDIEKAGLRDKAVTIGILQDKARAAYSLDRPVPLAVQINLGAPVDLSKYQ